MTRSSSPFDAETVARLEAKLARKKEKQREWESEQERKLETGPKLLVAASPSPRKKRRQGDEDQDDSTSRSRRFFDSTMLGPPPRQALFKPEASVSITRRESSQSKFSSHESAIPKSFLSQLQNEQESSKLDQLRRQRTLKRSTGFSSTTTSSTEIVSGLMKAREGSDLRVKLPKKLSSSDTTTTTMSTNKYKKNNDGSVIDHLRPSNSMSRPKSNSKAEEREAKKEFTVKRMKRDEDRSESDVDDDDDDDDDGLDITDGPSKIERKKMRRNKDSTVIEDLEMGPIDFVPPKHDPEFETIEPNSGIKLRQRLIPHERVQQLLSDRYHLTPSQIYSLARIDSRRQVHIDVDADFVIIGVLAWKDEIRFLNSNPLQEPKKETPQEIKRREKSIAIAAAEKQGDPLTKESSVEVYGIRSKKQKKQRYIRFEMVDLSSPQAAASGTGTLNVMLVEADTVDTGFDEDGQQVPIYKGQSGGAYEKYWKETPGALVAIINPSFLPYNPTSQGQSQSKPCHTLKPISADSMVVLGRAKDLTFCDAIKKKDGKKCNSWVDARVGTKCQYHIHLAVSRTGMGRAETFGNTASLKQTASIDFSKLKNSLRTSHPGANTTSTRRKPSALESSNSVMVQGHNTYIAGGSRSGTSTTATIAKTSSLNALTAGGIGLPTSRGSGGFIPGVRDGPIVSEEKRKKEREKLDRERGRRELKELGKRDMGNSIGGEYLRLARLKDKEKRKRQREADEKTNKNRDKKRKQDDNISRSSGSNDSGSEGEAGTSQPRERRRIFSSQAVRMIGYNPTTRPGDVRDEKDDDETLQQRLALEGGVRQSIKLTAPPGKKVVSGIRIDPETIATKEKSKKETTSRNAQNPVTKTTTAVHPRVRDDDDDNYDDDELFIEGAPAERIKLPIPPPRF